MIEVILVPTDGSDHARSAVTLAADLAQKYGARLVALHVMTPSGSDEVFEELQSYARAEYVQATEREILESVGQQILHSAEALAGEEGLERIDTLLEVGDAAATVLDVAKSQNVDLIVMGSRGIGKLKGLILGSVSHNVFHLAPCSCVTVNLKGGQSDLEGIKSILVPTDGSSQADKAVDLASELASKYGARLVLLHVMWRGPSLEKLRTSIDMDQLSENTRDELDPARHPIAEHMSSALISPVVSKDALKEIGEQILTRGQRTAEAKGVRTPTLVLLESDPALAIGHVAEREQADLIVLGSRGLGGVEGLLAGSVGSRGLEGVEGLLAGSVAYKVVHTARCSCMVVR
jgi:nucleotide-binding universal stress UspA family protein